MANLDLSVLVFCVMLDLILLIISVSISKSAQLMPLLPCIFGIFSLGYFVSNYTGIVFLGNTYVWTLFLIGYAFIAVLAPLWIFLERVL